MKNFSEVFSVISSTQSKFETSDILKLFAREKSKILLVGEVQSGKTKQIIDLLNTSMATSIWCFDIAIVFGGTNNNLNDQTQRRLEMDIKGDNFKFKQFNKDYIYSEDNGKHVIYIGPKTNAKLEEIKQVIDSIANIHDKKIIIIDDECDYGSINTGKELDSKYFTIINNLYKKIKNGGIISITATPFANLLNEQSGNFDRVFALTTKQKYGYKGINFFNKQSGFIINIEEEYVNNIWSRTRGDDSNRYFFSFCVYVLNCLIKMQIVDEVFPNNKADMLINDDYEKTQHDSIAKNIEEIREYALLNINTFIDEKLSHVKKHLKKEIVFTNDQVKSILDDIKVVVLNSDNKNDGRSNHNIYIGGVLLSRGITFENLVVEYIVNFPETTFISADTLLQMCRWFGYRKHLETFKYMNVITNIKGFNALYEIEKYNNLFFEHEHYGEEKDIAELKNSLINLDKECSYVKGCSSGKK